MFFAATKLMGPIKIEGSLSAYTLEIEAPTRPENEREQRDLAPEIARTTLEVGDITMSWYFKIATGATARVGKVVASDLHVDGTLAAADITCSNRIEVTGILTAALVATNEIRVGPGAMLECRLVDGVRIHAHRTAVLHGQARDRLVNNMWWARSLLTEAEKNPLTWFDKIDKAAIERLEAGFYLMGWQSHYFDRALQEMLLYPGPGFEGTTTGVTLPFDLASSVHNENRVHEALFHLAHPRGKVHHETHAYDVVVL
jgi:hypothetical protein